MQLSSRTRAVGAVIAVAVIAAYLVVVDLGIHAGRVHRGVSVAGHDVGTLTFPELVDELETHRDDLMEQPLTFTADGFEDEVSREELGWSPQPFETALEIFDVGRGEVWTAAKDRLQGWLGEVEVEWAGGVGSSRVSRILARWRQTGLDVDETAARELIRRIAGRDGSRGYEIPLD